MTESLFEHAGGDDGLHRLEELFYDKALADPVRVPAHVAQQNSWAETDAELNPIREVPQWDWSA